MKMRMMRLSNGKKPSSDTYTCSVDSINPSIDSPHRYDRFKNSEKADEEGDVSENDAEKDIDNKTDTDAAEQNGTESNV